MQKVKLPKKIEPFKSAVKRSDYQGVFVSGDMARLREAVDAVLNDIAIEIRFDIDAQGLSYFSGTLQTQVSLICQRCNHPFVHAVDTGFCFCPVISADETDEIPDHYEPVEVDEYGEVNLLDLFEDEVILALPIVPMHLPEDCLVDPHTMHYGEKRQDEKNNPFLALKKLKLN